MNKRDKLVGSVTHTYSKQQILELVSIYRLNPSLSAALSVAADSPLWTITTKDDAIFVLELLEKIQEQASKKNAGRLDDWISEGLSHE